MFIKNFIDKDEFTMKCEFCGNEVNWVNYEDETQIDYTKIPLIHCDECDRASLTENEYSDLYYNTEKYPKTAEYQQEFRKKIREGMICLGKESKRNINRKKTKLYLEHDSSEEVLVETSSGRFHVCVIDNNELYCVCPIYQDQLYKPCKTFLRGNKYEARERIDGCCLLAEPFWYNYVEGSDYNELLSNIYFKGNDGKSYSAGEISVFSSLKDPDRSWEIIHRKPKNGWPQVSKENEELSISIENLFRKEAKPYSPAIDTSWTGWGPGLKGGY